MSEKRFNKKGFFLAEETLKIILAVICIGFLIFVLGKAYYSYNFDKDFQQAKDTLKYVEKEVNLMKGGEQRELMIYSPSSEEKIRNKVKVVDYWILVSFGGQEKPPSCAGKDCLCMCKNVWVGNLKDKCEKEGICAVFSNKNLPVSQVDLLDLPMTLLIKQDDKDTLSFSRK